jgi:hypothetical protein
MGRDLRRVPPDWKHPTQRCQHWRLCDEAKRTGRCYQPMFDHTFEEGQKRRAECNDEPLTEDDRPYYRPEWPEGSATAYQVYENVSEGTPVSPVFQTKEEVIAWLQGQGHSLHAATKFVECGYAPSMVFSGGRSAIGIDVYDILGEEK